ncbi:putative membrane protein [Chryseobacterium nepalense]|nr:putative membrane protein [Chryseobacterium nepalense]
MPFLIRDVIWLKILTAMIHPLFFNQKFSLAVVIIITITAPIVGYFSIGLPPVIIVGGSALIALICWQKTYLKNPVNPSVILPLFVLTVAALQIHIVEEYQMGFAPAMSRLFRIPWSEKSFLMVFALVGPTVYTLTSLGLYYRIPIAGFVAWFIFIGPGVAEFTHFIFPLISPELLPHDPHSLTDSIAGSVIENMPNYYYKTTGTYYFPGMWTAVLPMIPGCFAIVKLLTLQKNNH